MSDDNAAGHAEIVIVRRRGGDDGAAAKGGAWKIAYADFVTAMMAFFLVMWLINASNEATRAQVASYFNPIKLTDATTGKKGLKEAKDNKVSKEDGGGAGGTPPAPSDAKHEGEIMSNPDKVLEKIEAQAKAMTPEAIAAAATPAAAAEAAPADPFEPPPAGTAESAAPAVENVPAATETPPKFSAEPPPKPDPHAEQAEIAKASPAEKNPAVEEHKAETAQSGAAQDTKTEQPEQPGKPGATQQTEEAVTAQDLEAEQIAQEIAKKLGTGLDQLPESVDVKRTADGILISLTDKENFGMFNNGSAEPVPQLVTLIDAIAGVLKDRSGYIVVRGHTDSKPYRIKTYDNWQLSTDRAHFAQYMLVRAGLDGSRIRRIEGVADREPRNANDPQAPENRRIEILLGQDLKS